MLHRDGITPNVIYFSRRRTLAVTVRPARDRVVGGLQRSNAPSVKFIAPLQTPPTVLLQHSTYNFLIPTVLLLRSWTPSRRAGSSPAPNAVTNLRTAK